MRLRALPEFEDENRIGLVRIDPDFIEMATSFPQQIIALGETPNQLILFAGNYAEAPGIGEHHVATLATPKTRCPPGDRSPRRSRRGVGRREDGSAGARDGALVVRSDLEQASSKV